MNQEKCVKMHNVLQEKDSLPRHLVQDTFLQASYEDGQEHEQPSLLQAQMPQTQNIHQGWPHELFAIGTQNPSKDYKSTNDHQILSQTRNR
jgi:hypothetical protein